MPVCKESLKKYIRVFGEKEELSYELSDLKSRAEKVRSQEEQIRALHENVRHLEHFAQKGGHGTMLIRVQEIDTIPIVCAAEAV